MIFIQINIISNIPVLFYNLEVHAGYLSFGLISVFFLTVYFLIIKKSKKKYIESPFELLLNEMGNTIKSYRIGYIEGNVNFVSLFFENSETIALKQMNNKNYSGMTIFFGTENKETNKMFEEESYLKKRYDYKKNSLDKFENLKIINIDAYVEK